MFRRAWHLGPLSVYLYGVWGPRVWRVCWGIDVWSVREWSERTYVQTWAQVGPLYVEADLCWTKRKGVEEDAGCSDEPGAWAPGS